MCENVPSFLLKQRKKPEGNEGQLKFTQNLLEHEINGEYYFLILRPSSQVNRMRPMMSESL